MSNITTKTPPVAILTVRRVAAMSPEQLTQLSAWLENQAAWLRENHRDCADVLRMRLLIREHGPAQAVLPHCRPRRKSTS